MDKKVLKKIVEDITETIQQQHGLDEDSARMMLGILLQSSKMAIVNAVNVPKLNLASTVTPAAPTVQTTPAPALAPSESLNTVLATS